MSKTFTFIDLFSGAGGLMKGFLNAGFKPIFVIDNWVPAIKTHKRNYPKVKIIEKDIVKVKYKEIKELTNKIEVDIIIGGPPCQGFSTIGKRLIKDSRNKLVFEFIRFVDVIKPRLFLMENVKGLLSSHGGVFKNVIKNEFEKVGYHNIISNVLCAADYGVPQKRYRVFFLGVRKDINIKLDFPKPIHVANQYVTVGETIMDLVGKECTVPNHVPMRHNKTVTERIKYIPEGSGLPKKGVPDELIFGSRKDFANKRIKNFSHIYKRLARNRVSTTMVPGHNAFPLHPVLNRALTVREAARLQTFDDNTVFEGTRQEQCILVGNAVPVKLAYILARNVEKYLTKL